MSIYKYMYMHKPHAKGLPDQSNQKRGTMCTDHIASTLAFGKQAKQASTGALD